MYWGLTGTSAIKGTGHTLDGMTLLDSQVQNLVSAMAGFSPPALGQTVLLVGVASALEPVFAANWL